MPQKLTSIIKDEVIDRQNVAWDVVIEVRRFDQSVISGLRSYLVSYSFNLNRDFASSTARLTFQNPEGIFSPDHPNPILRKGFVVRITEVYPADPSVQFDRFFGIIRQINPTKSAKGNEVEVFCYDALIKLQDTDIEKTFESAEKLFVEDEVLSANPLPAPVDFEAQVFDGTYSGWAQSPPPLLQIRSIGSAEVRTSVIDGMEIQYKTGQVILNAPINIEELEVKASYWAYTSGLYAEDIIESILLEPNSFGAVLFSPADLISTLSTEEGLAEDTLLPIPFPLNMTTTIEKKVTPTDTEIFIRRREGWKFTPNHSGILGSETLGDDVIQWTGKQDVVIANVLLTKLTGVTGLTRSYSKGARASVFYNGNAQTTQAWRTTYTHLTSVVAAADFQIPGGSFASFDPRFGILLLNSPIATSAEVLLNKDYTFKTLQATGIEIPYLRLSRDKYQNRYDAIKNEILNLLPPNYVLFSRGSSKIWGLFLNQKPDGNEDYELKLNTRLQYIQDQEVYTRVSLRGQNNTPHNIMLDESTKILGVNETGLTFSGYAIDQELFLANPEELRPNGSYLAFTPFTDIRSRTNLPDSDIYPSWREGDQLFVPVVKINGASIGSQTLQVAQRPVSVDGTKVRFDHNTLLPPDGSAENSLVLFDQSGVPLDDFFSPNVTTHLTADIHPNDTVIYTEGVGGFPSSGTAFIGMDEIQYTARVGNNLQGVTGIDQTQLAGATVTLYHPLLFPRSETVNEDQSSFTLFDRKGKDRGRVYREGDHAIWESRYPESFTKLIRSASYTIVTAVSIQNNQPAFVVSGKKFLVNRNLLTTRLVSADDVVHVIEDADLNTTYAYSERLAVDNVVTATFKYRTLLGRFDSPLALRDGDPRTEAQLAWVHQTPLKGQTIFIVDFGSLKKIQAIDIIAGRYFPFKAIDSQMALDCQFKLTMKASKSAGAATLIANATTFSTNAILSETVNVKAGQLAGFPTSGTGYIGSDAFQYTGIQRKVSVILFTGNPSRPLTLGTIVDRFTGVTGLSEDHFVVNNAYELITSEPLSEVSAGTSNFSLKSGDNVSFESEQLGEDFECRLLAFVVESVEKVEISKGTLAYPISIASLNVYADILYEAKATLTPTTRLTASVLPLGASLFVESTVLFPAQGTGYIGLDRFTYTGKTPTSFTGVQGIDEAHPVTSFITQENIWDENSPTIGDPNGLLSEFGDRVYKDRQVQKDVVDPKYLKLRAKQMLAEFYKNHHKVRIDNVFAPYTYLGQTMRLVDPYWIQLTTEWFTIERNYFIEAISCNNGKYSLDVSFYP